MGAKDSVIPACTKELRTGKMFARWNQTVERHVYVACPCTKATGEMQPAKLFQHRCVSSPFKG